MKMKIYVCIAFAFFAFCGMNLLQGQASDPHKTVLRGGFTSGNLSDSGDKLFTGSFGGWYLGGYREKSLAFLHLGYGLEYYQTGSRENDDNMLKLGYMSLPVHLKLKIGPVGVMGGLSGAVRVFAQEKINGEITPNVGDKYTSFDATTYLGASFKLLFFGADIRYHWGLTNVTKGGTGNFKNNFLEVGANLYF